MKKTAAVLLLLLAGGCAHGGGLKVAKTPKVVDPFVEAKLAFIDHYGFFLTRDKKVTYYKDAFGIEEKEIKIFAGLKTLGELDKFKEIFFKVRDIDPGTPENEFMELVDSRVEEIKNEVLFKDFDTPGVSFDRNGGFRGDMAHVYLFYGKPHFKALLRQNQYHLDLMVWYYFDEEGKQLFRFLFFDRGQYQLFQNYSAIPSFEYLIDPMISPLKYISISLAPSQQDLYDLWMSLAYYEMDSGPFIMALLSFSYYEDIHINDALDPPEPAALVAARYKPKILGEPEDLSGRSMLFGKYKSFIPGLFRIIKNEDGTPRIYAPIIYSALDWEIRKDGKAECLLSLRVNILNKKTATSVEFTSLVKITLPEGEATTGKSVYLLLNLMDGGDRSGNSVKLQQLLEKLPAGDYIIDIDLIDLRTKKQLIAIKDFAR